MAKDGHTCRAISPRCGQSCGALGLAFERPGTEFRLLPWDGDAFVLAVMDAPVLAATMETSSPQLVQFQRTVHGTVDRVRLGDGQEIELVRAAGG